MELTDKELELLNSKIGLKTLLYEEEVNPEKAVKHVIYEKRIKKLQTELIKLQNWAVRNKKKIVIIFEGEMLPEKAVLFVEL